MEWHIHSFEEVTSTNDRVKAAIDEGAPEGFVCRASTQTSGYGRQGRQWSSQRGGLYQSVLLRPSKEPAELPTLSLVVALAIASVAQGAIGPGREPVQVKWPNDILMGSKKLVGISCEAHQGAVCVGMGMNVFRPENQGPIPGKNIPSYIYDDGPMSLDDRAEATIAKLGDAILEKLSVYYERWQREGFPPFIEEYEALDCLDGRPVELCSVSGEVLAAGMARGIDDEGRLVVDDDQGQKHLGSGEAHVIWG